MTDQSRTCITPGCGKPAAEVRPAGTSGHIKYQVEPARCPEHREAFRKEQERG